MGLKEHRSINHSSYMAASVPIPVNVYEPLALVLLLNWPETVKEKPEHRCDQVQKFDKSGRIGR